VIFLTLWRTKYRDFGLRHSDEVFSLLNGFSPKATAVAVTNQNWALVTVKVLSTFLRLDREEIQFSSICSSLRKLEGENTKRIRFSGFNQFLSIM
jgi:hypothetical protein